MEQTSHPLDNLYPNNHLLLIEAMIPYIEPSMQLPLALYIKYQEMLYILHAFHDPTHLCDCGFRNHPMSNDELLITLGHSMGLNLEQSIKQFKQMNQMQEIMTQMNTSPPIYTSDPTNIPNDFRKTPATNDFSHTREDFISAIHDILDERTAASHYGQTDEYPNYYQQERNDKV